MLTRITGLAGLIASSWLMHPLHAQRIATSPRLIEELRISGVRDSLAPISGLAVSDRGRIAIGQPGENTILVYEPDGKAIGRFGRTGDGPGEFRRLGDFGWLGDSLYVPGLRLTVVSPDLHLIRTVPWSDPVRFPPGAMSAPALLGLPRALRLFDGGSRLGVGFVMIPGDGSAPAPGRLYLVISASGEVERVITMTPPDMLPGFLGVLAIQAFSEVDPSGRYVAVVSMPDLMVGAGSKHTWKLSVFETIRGALPVLAKEFAYVPVPTPARMIDSLRQLNTPPPSPGPPASVSPPPMGNPAGGGRARGAGPQPFYPDFLPPVRRLLVGRDGTLWIERWTVLPGHTWDELDSRGAAVRTIVLPPNVNLLVAQRDKLWAVELDPDDLPSVVRYRISG